MLKVIAFTNYKPEIFLLTKLIQQFMACWDFVSIAPGKVDFSFSPIQPERGLRIEWEPLTCEISPGKVIEYWVFLDNSTDPGRHGDVPWQLHTSKYA